MSKVIGVADVVESETVNAKAVVPALPSLSVTGAMVRFGAASSLVMVPIPALPARIAAGETLLIATENVSSPSGSVSPFTTTVNVNVVAPAAIVAPVIELLT